MRSDFGSLQAERKREKLSSVTARGMQVSIFFQYAADGIIAAGLLFQIMIKSPAVYKNDIGCREKFSAANFFS